MVVLKKEYQELKISLLEIFIESAEEQKRLFLLKLIHSIVVHENKIVVRSLPPVLISNKGPYREKKRLFVIDLAYPNRRFR